MWGMNKSNLSVPYLFSDIKSNLSNPHWLPLGSIFLFCCLDCSFWCLLQHNVTCSIAKKLYHAGSR